MKLAFLLYYCQSIFLLLQDDGSLSLSLSRFHSFIHSLVGESFHDINIAEIPVLRGQRIGPLRC